MAQGVEEILSLPQGGGAIGGLGETYATDAQTGTGRYSVPLGLPPGRGAASPTLSIDYDTGSGNGVCGLGCAMSVPGIRRRTSGGVPVYDDDVDGFLLSGTEDLVVVGPTADGGTRYRPRTEGAYADVVHHRSPGQDHWTVTDTDGLRSTYGSVRPAGAGPEWRDPATTTDPEAPDHVFAWMLTETRDTLGNRVLYGYDADEGTDGPHRWRQPLLARMSYVDLPDGDFLVSVVFDHEPRPDAFSAYTAGFEIRTTRRYSAVRTFVRPEGVDVPVRRYELEYHRDPYNGMSLLGAVALVGVDDDGAQNREMPPVTFTYSRLDPARRRLRGVGGPTTPVLTDPSVDLVDVLGYGVPDLVQGVGGSVRHWRNRGDGTFDAPRSMAGAPPVRLGAPGVALLDVDGDGRADLVVDDPVAPGWYPLRAGARWGAFRRFDQAPAVGLGGSGTRLLDLTGDGATDAVLGPPGALQCLLGDGDRAWSPPRPVRFAAEDPPPPIDLSDPRVQWADMSGDGLPDLVLLRGRSVDYWTNRGHGRFGRRVRMRRAPALPAGYDPAQVRFGDVDGDGLADMVHVAGGTATVWINRGGEEWSDPITVHGVPVGAAPRLVDLVGTGAAGLLWTGVGPGASSASFLDLTGGVRPRLLTGVDTHRGAVTTIEYATSTAFAQRDHAAPATRWRTTLPIPVAVVRRVVTTDLVTGTTTSTSFAYAHGHWDGSRGERAFRGFGRVDRVDVATRDGSSAAPADPDDAPAAPTLTRTWFHVGPLEDDGGGVAGLETPDEHWAGDPGRLPDPLAAPGRWPDAGAARDALRALRGRERRRELYALDGTGEAARPYTVVETSYDVREETAAGAHRVHVALEVATRTTRWERGDDPMTAYTFHDAHDELARPRRSTSVALPRWAARREPVTGAVAGVVHPDPTTVLASQTRTEYAAAAGSPVRDRVAQVRTYELAAPPTVPGPAPDLGALADAHRLAALAVREAFEDPAAVVLRGHTVHHYDGAPYEGGPVGDPGAHGLLSRTEVLVATDALLDQAWGASRPAALGGPAAPPPGAPAGFGSGLGYHRHDAGGAHAAGWYADTVRRAYDVTVGAARTRGLLLGVEDPCGRRTEIVPDALGVVPALVRDAAGLETTAEHDHRTGHPRRVVDPNGTSTTYRFHPLGTVAAVVVRDAAGHGDTDGAPGVRYDHDLAAFARDGQPVSVHTTHRVWRADDGVSDEVVESRAYLDGLGRVLQTRRRADELGLGDDGGDAGLLVTDPSGATGPRAEPGRVGGPATGHRDPDRVLVSGWRHLDDKGRVVAEYEPFFGRGWDYRPHEAGRPRRTRYDPTGRVVEVRHPDGSRRRTGAGSPLDAASPDTAAPSPWTVTTYDENDLAPRSTSPDGASLAARAPATSHLTPTTTVLDALARPVAMLTRGATAAEHLVTRTVLDLRGGVVATLDAHGRTAYTHVRDLLGRVLRTTSIDAGVVLTVPDATGAPVERHGDGGALTLRTYDALGRPDAVYARDRAGQPVTRREWLVYGDAGDPQQPTVERSAARADRRLGRLRHHWDEAGLVTTDLYDVAGAATERRRWTIRAEAIAAADGDGTGEGWVADWAAPGARDDLAPSPEVTSVGYDALGRTVSLEAPSGAGGARRRLTYTYGRSGTPVAVHLDGEAAVRTLVHDARGRRVLTELGNGVITRLAYDADTGGLVRLRSERATRTGDVWAGTGEPLQDLTYTHDLLGAVTAIDERTPGCGVAGSPGGRDRLLRTFEHDPFGRLVSATGRACAAIPSPRPPRDDARCGRRGAPFGSPTPGNAPDQTGTYVETYTWDPAGNLVDLHHRDTADGAGGWHRRLGLDGRAPQAWADAATNRATGLESGASTTDLVVDAAGRLVTEGGTRHYRWDHAGRLAGVRVQNGTGTSVSARYLYGADGERVLTWVRRGGAAGTDEVTVRVGEEFERHRWASGSGGEQTLVHVVDDATRVVTARSGDAHPDDGGPAVRYALVDHLAGVTVTLDDTAGWVAREEFFPHGETSFGGFARKRYRWIGALLDDESGLVRLGARYYAPGTARWISPDPLGPDLSGTPYGYGGGDPLNAVDRSGAAPGVPTSAKGAGEQPALNIADWKRQVDTEWVPPDRDSPMHWPMTDYEFSYRFHRYDIGQGNRMNRVDTRTTSQDLETGYIWKGQWIADSIDVPNDCSIELDGLGSFVRTQDWWMPEGRDFPPGWTFSDVPLRDHPQRDLGELLRTDHLFRSAQPGPAPATGSGPPWDPASGASVTLGPLRVGALKLEVDLGVPDAPHDVARLREGGWTGEKGYAPPAAGVGVPRVPAPGVTQLGTVTGPVLGHGLGVGVGAQLGGLTLDVTVGASPLSSRSLLFGGGQTASAPGPAGPPLVGGVLTLRWF